MVSNGSCGHRPMIWRPLDMVSVVDRPIDELIEVDCCVLCVKKYGTLVRTLTKKSGLAQLTFFNCSLGNIEVSFVIKYPYLICRA
jgi:hypothetical protein